MAERRMFALTIIDSDAFMDMPLTAQSLYMHLAMRADDDGFINNPRKIQRMIGATDDDMQMLLDKRFILRFPSGVIVIKHWRINNYIQKDRYKGTLYQEEKEQLIIKENGAYTENRNASETLDTGCIQKTETLDTGCIQKTETLDTGCIQGEGDPVYEMDTQVRLGKDRLGKDRLGKDRLGNGGDNAHAQEDAAGDGDMPFGITEEDITASLETDSSIEQTAKLWGLPCHEGHMLKARDMAREYTLDWLRMAIAEAGNHGAGWPYVASVLRNWKAKGGPENCKQAPKAQTPRRTVTAQRYEQRDNSEADLMGDDMEELLAAARAARDKG